LNYLRPRVFHLLCALALLSICGNLTAGTDTTAAGSVILGQVVDRDDGQALPGATVTLENRFGGAIADESGRFELRNLPSGQYDLLISQVGYRPERLGKLELAAGDTLNLEITLTVQVVKLSGMTVMPGRFEIMGNAPTSSQSLTQAEIETMPQLGEDLYRTVNRLPGVSSSDFSARFTVRGGEHDEVLVTLDGLELFEPFHLKDVDGGAISIIDVRTIGGLDLMTGGFSADFGDRMSGVFNLNSRRPRNGDNKLSVGVSFIHANIAGEGTFAEGRGSWLVSARRGYLDLVLKLMEEDDDLRPRFYDLFAKTRYQLSDRQELELSFLHAGDDLRYRYLGKTDADSAETSWNSSYLWTRLTSAWSTRFTSTTVASLGNLNHDRDWREAWPTAGLVVVSVEDNEKFRSAAIRTDMELEASSNVLLRGGLELNRQRVDYDYLSQSFSYSYSRPDGVDRYSLARIDSVHSQIEPSGTRFGSYLAGRFRPLGFLTTELGLRYDRYSHLSTDRLSPRVNVRYDLTRATSVRAGWGFFYQAQALADLDVADANPQYHNPEKAEHFVLGLEHRFPHGMQLRLEAYLKRYSDLKPDYRNAFSNVDMFPEINSDRVVVYRNGSESKGLEFYFKKDDGGRFTWWASYSLSRVHDETTKIQYAGGEIVNPVGGSPSPFDQRHTLYLDLSYRPNYKWQFNVAFQYRTGWPYTEYSLGTEQSHQGLTYFWVKGEPWSSRHEPFHRLDLRINRNFELPNGRLTTYLEVVNVLDHENIRDYHYEMVCSRTECVLERTPERWLGILPSLGVVYKLDF